VFPRLKIDRALVYLYLVCVLVVAIATLDERAQWSQALGDFKPFLEPAANLTSFALDPAVFGLMICPFAMIVLALMKRISQQSAWIGCALFAASILLLIPAIQ
jgi:hypothetical protein